MNVLESIVALRRALFRAGAASFGGLSGRAVFVLREIRSTGPSSQVNLARATATDPSMMVRLIADLERRGLISRRRREEDRREMIVSLTAEGKRALRPLDVAYEKLARAVESSLTPEEGEFLVGLAARIVLSLDAYSAAPERFS